MRRNIISGFLIACGVALFATTGMAQTQSSINLAPDYVPTADEDYPVMARPRPEYDAKGIPLGGFRLFPTLDLGGSYDSNILRTDTDYVDDYIFNIVPTYKIQSQWNQHMLEFYGGLNDYQYAQNTSENVTTWNAGADGRYDVTGGTFLYANGVATHLFESRSSPNSIGLQAAPNEYFQYHGELSGTYQPNRLGVSLGGQIDSYIYQYTPMIGGGYEDNQDRNMTEYQAFAKALYDFSPGYSGFVRAVYDDRAFDQFLDRTGVHRSSLGYRIDGGVDLQLSHLISGEIYLGYLQQDFAKPLPNVDGLDYSVRIDWLATPLLTVHLQGGRSLTQVILQETSVSDDKSVGLSADYELLRNLIIQASGNYIDSTYPGIAREDEYPQFGVGARYLINNYASAHLSYTYSERTTNIPVSGFNDNLIALSLDLHI
jgi:hypothetical protein